MDQDLLVDGTVDIRTYLKPLVRQRRQILATVIILTLVAAVYTFTRTPIYKAKTTVLLKPTGVNLLELGPTGTDKLINLDTEVQLAGSTPVATLAATALGGGATAAQLLKQESAAAVTTSQAIEISFSDPNPSMAQRSAAAFAKEYLAYRQTQAVNQIDAQKTTIAMDLKDVQARISTDNAALASSSPQSAKFQTAKTDLATALDQLSALNSQAAAVGLLNTDPGQVLIAAQVPKQPSSPNRPLDIALGLLMGLVLGVGIAFVRGRTDQHIREAADLEEVLGVPSLAAIPRVKGPQTGKAGLVAVHQPSVPASETYRALRTTLMAAMGAETWTLLVVSPFAGEGKTTVASNLAVMLAKADKRVVLVSADMRQPRLHELFELPNRKGLSDILSGSHSVEACLLPTELPNLIVCPAGPVPLDPAELLQSRSMSSLLKALREAADCVILDCPPILAVADALGLVPMSDASILVVDSVTTMRGAVTEARNHLEQVGARLLGGVLNNVPPPGPGGLGYGYGYGPIEAADGEVGSAKR